MCVCDFWSNVDLALTLAMGTFTENPCARVTILGNKRRTNVDFWSKCWFGADVGDGHFYRESLSENDNSMKQETHKCIFFFQMLIWRWRWPCGNVKENPCARMRIPCRVFINKYCFFIKHVDFSLEKCRFGAKKGVSHYVLRRDLVIFAKNDNFELEICIKAKKGRTALQPEASLSLIC